MFICKNMTTELSMQTSDVKKHKRNHYYFDDMIVIMNKIILGIGFHRFKKIPVISIIVIQRIKEQITQSHDFKIPYHRSVKQGRFKSNHCSLIVSYGSLIYTNRWYMNY